MMCKLTAYSDESGSFNPRENGVFVLAGFLFLDQALRVKATAAYLSCESILRAQLNLPKNLEIKAAKLLAAAQSALLEYFSGYPKFAIIVNQSHLDHFLLDSSKARQRYLDHMYAIGFSKCIKQLLDNHQLPNSAEYDILLLHDKHCTATKQKYELAQAVESVLKLGTTPGGYCPHSDPIFPALRRVDMDMVDSENSPLVRLADMLANRIYRIESGFLPTENFPNLTVYRCSVEDLRRSIRTAEDVGNSFRPPFMLQPIGNKIPMVANSPFYPTAL